MPTQRRSDENSNPELEIELKPRTTTIKVESKASINKPLLQSNEASSSANNKKKLSTFERKEKERFKKSGMKKGSLFKYFVKDNPEEMQRRSLNTKRSTRNRSSSTNTTNFEAENAISRNVKIEDQGQNSEVECLGAIARQVSIPGNAIAISSESGESVSQEEFNADSPQVSDYDVHEYDINQNEHQHHDVEFVINNLDNQELSGEDKIERWQRQNKRMLQDDEHTTSKTGDYSELQPPPSKASKLEILCQDENTPDKSQGSNTCTPPLRIVNVYTLSKKDDTIPPSTSTGSSERSAGDKAKKSISFYKEIENPILTPLMKKKNWRKIVDIISKDFKDYKLPAKFVFSEMIRRAILCEGTRVSKDVQSDSVTLLEEIIKHYPPHKGNGRDPSVKYYRGILEKVFDDESSVSSVNRSKLFGFLEQLHQRLLVEKNALQVLVLVTRLVCNQYDVYEREAGVKVHPPLFQYFLEEKEGVFTYNSFCKNILGKCFKAESDEEFCIYLKWVDLISRRLGEFPVRRKDYLQMVKDFAEQCSVEQTTDLGLPLLMNLAYKPFSKLICEVIFERLRVIRVAGEENENEQVSETDRLFYLTELSKTLLIKPAGDIVSDIVEEVCKGSSSLSFSRLKVDANHSNQQKSDNKDGRGRKKNVKGETRLHILRRPGGQENVVPDVMKHLQAYPEDINVRDNFGNTPLHDCAKNNKGNIIMTFMNEYRNNIVTSIDFLARNESLETPMHLAATYCEPKTTEIMIYFATSCGVIDQVLKMANKNGKLPFQLAPANSQIKRKLTPSGYDKQRMLTHGGMTLDKQSVELLETSFELKKILAWWSQNCL